MSLTQREYVNNADQPIRWIHCEHCSNLFRSQFALNEPFVKCPRCRLIASTASNNWSHFQGCLMRMSINNAAPGLKIPLQPKIQHVKTICRECRSIVYVTQSDAPHRPDEGIGHCACGGDTCGCSICSQLSKTN